MEQGYQVDGVHDRDLIPFRHHPKVCGRGGIGGGGGGGGGRVEPYITPPKGGLMEQGYQTEVRGGESGHWVVSRSHQTMPERIQVDGGGGGG